MSIHTFFKRLSRSREDNELHAVFGRVLGEVSLSLRETDWDALEDEHGGWVLTDVGG